MSTSPTFMRHFTRHSYLIVLLAFSCTEPPKDAPKTNVPEKETSSPIVPTVQEVESNSFQQYLEHFSPIDLPLTVNSFELSQDSLNKMARSDYEKIRTGAGFQGFDFYPFKMLAKEEHFIALLSLETNHLYTLTPVLETYTHDGELIDIKALDFHNEESETSRLLEQKATILPDLQFSFEALSEIYDLTEVEDENGNYLLAEVPGSRNEIKETAEGKVDPTGHITLIIHQK